MDEKEIQRLLAQRGDKPSRRGWRCPDETRIAAYADGRLGGAARSSVEAHVADCDHCRAQVAFLVRAAESPADVAVPAQLISRARSLVTEKPRESGFRGWRWAATAAVACLILTVGLTLVLKFGRPEAAQAPELIAQSREQGAPPAPPISLATQTPAPAAATPPVPAARADTPRPKTERTPAPATRKPSANPLLPELLSPRDGAVLRRGGLEFRWRPVGEAVFYEVSLMSAAGDLVFQTQTAETRLTLPADVALASGAKYFVWVRAHLRQGKTSKSDLVSFRLAE